LNFFSNSFLFSLLFSKNRLSFANNCYGCCYLLFCHSVTKLQFFTHVLERPMFVSLIFYSIICSFAFVFGCQ